VSQKIRSGIFLLLVFGAAANVHAQSHARFSVEPSEPALQAGVGEPGTEFSFKADVSDVQSYRFEFGDGNFEEAAVEAGASPVVVVSHSYGIAGRYRANLVARLASGESIELPLEIRVELPVSQIVVREGYARFSVSPSQVTDEDGDAESWADFTFVADVSNAESYAIDFGDGSVDRIIAPGPDGRAAVRHSYGQAGEYTALMNAFRNNGESVEQAVSVSVVAPLEIRSQASFFSVTPTDPETHADVDRPWADYTFVADVLGARDFRFDFGDGSEAVSMSANEGKADTRHVYPRDGHYDALITANPGSSDAVQKTLTITVIEPAPPKPIEEPESRWPWILLILAILALLAALWKLLTVKTGTHLVTFEPRLEAGKVGATGSSVEGASVSMHVRRDSGRLVHSVSDGA
jgi:PKD repeat protein